MSPPSSCTCPTRAGRSAATGACEQSLVSFIPLAIRVPRFAETYDAPRPGRQALSPKSMPFSTLLPSNGQLILFRSLWRPPSKSELLRARVLHRRLFRRRQLFSKRRRRRDNCLDFSAALQASATLALKGRPKRSLDPEEICRPRLEPFHRVRSASKVLRERHGLPTLVVKGAIEPAIRIGLGDGERHTGRRCFEHLKLHLLPRRAPCISLTRCICSLLALRGGAEREEVGHESVASKNERSEVRDTVSLIKPSG